MAERTQVNIPRKDGQKAYARDEKGYTPCSQLSLRLIMAAGTRPGAEGAGR